VCRLNHHLAANGTMSWPHFGVQQPWRNASAGLSARSGTIRWPKLQVWKHQMAATRDRHYQTANNDVKSYFRSFAPVCPWLQAARIRESQTAKFGSLTGMPNV
jgi:hypothetical protein